MVGDLGGLGHDRAKAHACMGVEYIAIVARGEQRFMGVGKLAGEPWPAAELSMHAAPPLSRHCASPARQLSAQ